MGQLFRRTVWKSDEEVRRSKTWLLPLFGHSVDRSESGSRETERSTWALWPLYRRWSVSDDEGRIVERKRRFAIFSDEIARSGERTFKLLGLPIIERMPAEG